MEREIDYDLSLVENHLYTQLKDHKKAILLPSTSKVHSTAALSKGNATVVVSVDYPATFQRDFVAEECHVTPYGIIMWRKRCPKSATHLNN